jgi:hypothetical protein
MGSSRSGDHFKRTDARPVSKSNVAINFGSLCGWRGAGGHERKGVWRDEPLLPKYPLSSDERSDPASRCIHWRLVAVRLVIRSLIIGFIVLLLFTMALLLTGGQLLWLFGG